MVEVTPLLSLPQLCSWLNVTERHVRGLVARNAIPVRRVGRALRFDVVEIEAWMQTVSACRSTVATLPISQTSRRTRPVARRNQIDRGAARAIWAIETRYGHRTS